MSYHSLFRPAGKLLAVLLLFWICSGCLYPDEEQQQNPAAGKEYLLVVQNAVNEYQKETGLLPIRNSTVETPVYEKYIIDFKMLKNRGFISEIPSNAFEKGGGNYYLILNEETHPEVKLLNLSLFQQVEKVQKWVDTYKTNHYGRLPTGPSAAPHFNWIDFMLLKEKEQQVRSLYTGNYLSLMMHESGRVVINYAPDLMQLVNKGTIKPTENTDLRTLLVEQFPYAPAKSYPYYWVNDEPQISIK